MYFKSLFTVVVSMYDTVQWFLVENLYKLKQYAIDE